jgi:hypothetical protein
MLTRCSCCSSSSSECRAAAVPRYCSCCQQGNVGAHSSRPRCSCSCCSQAPRQLVAQQSPTIIISSSPRAAAVPDKRSSTLPHRHQAAKAEPAAVPNKHSISLRIDTLLPPSSHLVHSDCSIPAAAAAALAGRSCSISWPHHAQLLSLAWPLFQPVAAAVWCCRQAPSLPSTLCCCCSTPCCNAGGLLQASSQLQCPTGAASACHIDTQLLSRQSQLWAPAGGPTAGATPTAINPAAVLVCSSCSIHQARCGALQQHQAMLAQLSSQSQLRAQLLPPHPAAVPSCLSGFLLP